MPGLAVIVAVIDNRRVLLTKARDRSGLTRQQFYLQRIRGAEIIEVVEVGNV